MGALPPLPPSAPSPRFGHQMVFDALGDLWELPLAGGWTLVKE